MQYTCNQNDVLDDICFSVYGTEQMVSEVLKANPDLANQGVYLPQGLVIELPEIKTEETAVQTIKLWD